MASDARAIVVGDAPVAPQPPPSQAKLQKLLQQNKPAARSAAEAAERKQPAFPSGMHRELFNLVGGRVPIAPASSYSQDTARQSRDRRVRKWEWRKFRNEARHDGLQLSHWARADETPPQYPFVQFNKSCVVPTYTSEEYAKYLRHEKWHEAETNVLFALCRRFDKRFVIVHDRYSDALNDHFTANPALSHSAASRTVRPRSVEDLKDRFYSVCRKLAIARGMPPDSEQVKYRYDAKHEALRKEQLRKLNSRSFAEIQEEYHLRQELKKFGDKAAGGSSAKPGKGTKTKASKSATKAAAVVAGAVSSAGGVGSGGEAAAADGGESSDAKRRRKRAADTRGAAAADPKKKKKRRERSRSDTTDPTGGMSLPTPDLGRAYARSTAVARSLSGLKPKLVAQVTRHCDSLGMQSTPMPSEKIVQLHNQIKAGVLTMINLQHLLEQRQTEFTQMQQRHHPSGKKHGKHGKQRP